MFDRFGKVRQGQWHGMLRQEQDEQTQHLPVVLVSYFLYNGIYKCVFILSINDIFRRVNGYGSGVNGFVGPAKGACLDVDLFVHGGEWTCCTESMITFSTDLVWTHLHTHMKGRSTVENSMRLGKQKYPPPPPI